MDLLLSRGADAGAKNSNGQTAAALADDKDLKEVLKTLAKRQKEGEKCKNSNVVYTEDLRKKVKLSGLPDVKEQVRKRNLGMETMGGVEGSPRLRKRRKTLRWLDDIHLSGAGEAEVREPVRPAFLEPPVDVQKRPGMEQELREDTVWVTDQEGLEEEWRVQPGPELPYRCVLCGQEGDVAVEAVTREEFRCDHCLLERTHQDCTEDSCAVCRRVAETLEGRSCLRAMRGQEEPGSTGQLTVEEPPLPGEQTGEEVDSPVKKHLARQLTVGGRIEKVTAWLTNLESPYTLQQTSFETMEIDDNGFSEAGPIKDSGNEEICEHPREEKPSNKPNIAITTTLQHIISETTKLGPFVDTPLDKLKSRVFISQAKLNYNRHFREQLIGKDSIIPDDSDTDDDIDCSPLVKEDYNSYMNEAKVNNTGKQIGQHIVGASHEVITISDDETDDDIYLNDSCEETTERMNSGSNPLDIYLEDTFEEENINQDKSEALKSNNACTSSNILDTTSNDSVKMDDKREKAPEWYHKKTSDDDTIDDISMDNISDISLEAISLSGRHTIEDKPYKSVSKKTKSASKCIIRATEYSEKSLWDSFRHSLGGKPLVEDLQKDRSRRIAGAGQEQERCPQVKLQSVFIGGVKRKLVEQDDLQEAGSRRKVPRLLEESLQELDSKVETNTDITTFEEGINCIPDGDTTTISDKDENQELIKKNRKERAVESGRLEAANKATTHSDKTQQKTKKSYIYLEDQNFKKVEKTNYDEKAKKSSVKAIRNTKDANNTRTKDRIPRSMQSKDFNSQYYVAEKRTLKDVYEEESDNESGIDGKGPGSLWRQPYSRAEEQAVLDFLVHNGGYSLVGGLRVWMDMEEQGVCPGRSAQALRYSCFLVNLIPLPDVL